MNRREYPRLECELETTMISNGYFFHDKLMNVSEGGAMLEIHTPVFIGRDILLKTKIGDKKIVAIGDVKWVDCSQKKAGIQFLYIPASLKRFIRGMAKQTEYRQAVNL